MIKLKYLLDEEKYWFVGENPTVDAVIMNKNKILLIKRRGETENGKWALPGGFVESQSKKNTVFQKNKETFKTAVVREVKEETSIDLTPYLNKIIFVNAYVGGPNDPRGTNNKWSKNYLYIVNTGDDDIISHAGDDASDSKWVSIEDINKLSLAFDHKKLISDALKRLKILNAF